MKDILGRLIELHGEYAEGDSRIGIDLADAIREIERLREATRWRSVAEELPEEGDCVIVRHTQRCGDGECSIASVCEAEFYRVDDNRFGFAGQYCDALKVTHWQPLPDPPK